MILLKIDIKQDIDIEETQIEVKYPKQADQQTKELLKYLNTLDQKMIVYDHHRAYRIHYQSIFYIESVDDKTFIYLENAVYESSLKLYEWEEQLKDASFIRISKSTILNIAYLASVKPLFGGKMEAKMINDEKVVVNRHYLSAFKKAFGL